MNKVGGFIGWALIVSTLRLPSAKGQPQITDLRGTSTTTLNVEWQDDVVLASKSWIIETSATEKQFIRSTAVTLQNNTFEIEELTPGTSYQVRVARISIAGIGLYSNSSTATTFKLIEIEPGQDPLIKLYVGNPVNLSCNFYGNPLPYVEWLLDNTTLLDGVNEIQIITINTSSRLIAPDSMGLRGGEYRCSVNNRTSLAFIVEYYPQRPTKLRYSSTFITLTINWKFQLNGSSPRTGVKIEVRRYQYLVNSMAVNPEETSVSFHSLIPLAVYTIEVRVISNVGSSLPARTTAVTLFPTIKKDSNSIPATIGTISVLALLVLTIIVLFFLSLVFKYVFSKRTKTALKEDISEASSEASAGDIAKEKDEPLLKAQSQTPGAPDIKAATVDGNKNDVMGDGSKNDVMGDGSKDDVMGDGSKDDVIRDGSKDDVIRDGSKDDVIRDGSKDDVIRDGSKDDAIRDGSKDDAIGDGSKVDVIRNGSKDDVIHDGSKDDAIGDGSKVDVIHDGSKDDAIGDGSNVDVIRNGSKDDAIGDESKSDAMGDVGTDAVKNKLPTKEKLHDFYSSKAY